MFEEVNCCKFSKPNELGRKKKRGWKKRTGDLKEYPIPRGEGGNKFAGLEIGLSSRDLEFEEVFEKVVVVVKDKGFADILIQLSIKLKVTGVLNRHRGIG